MAEMVCLIQAGQAAERNRQVLEMGLRKLGSAALGDAPDAEISWVVMEKGYAWTAGEPSTSSIVVRSVPPGYAPVEREELIRRISDLWVRETGCSIEEIVVTAWDGPLPL